LTLVQTHKISSFPIVLVGTEFWSGLVDWIKTTMMKQGLISPGDDELFAVVDTPAEAIAAVQNGIAKLVQE
ncbi:MAG: LOG family protein, partial [Arcanobacterium sp.]|nr:LOG family protein [Arcanobacterium sp.]